MEPELREDQHASAPADTKRPEPQPKYPAFTGPFPSEGLEGLRDSHC
jgi:hypothetical protein